jgi:hypothetical protein
MIPNGGNGNPPTHSANVKGILVTAMNRPNTVAPATMTIT